jgi:Domain of unknown function (DUF4178)
MVMSSFTAPQSGPAKPQVKALNCPNCGAAITLRSFEQAITVVCAGCHSILNAKDPGLRVLQQFEAIVGEDPPRIPLGTRGKIRGTEYEVIGFQRRSLESDGIQYNWHEYLLFNPYKGFRYLTEYQGHWNDVVTCKDLPSIGGGLAGAVNYLGETYRHFQSADANTDYVIGEFPWQVRVGERVSLSDYIHPPRVLSAERTAGEVNWSIGEYVTGRDVWAAFRLPGHPPDAIGVYENQPSPMSADVSRVWTVFLVFAIFLVALMAFSDMLARKELVLNQAYQLSAGVGTGEMSFVTDVFELKGRTSNLQIATSADVKNNWIYLNYALINVDTGRAWDFGREVSFYSGYDSDGAWKEGSQNDKVIIPSVPAGKYYLRIEPEADRAHPRINYWVQVTRDVPVFGWYGVAFLALVAPALVVTWRSFNFERMRWSESDHSPAPLLQTGDN